jgi:ankyrin repeat protein
VLFRSDAFGSSALHVAAARGDAGVVELLLRSGFDPTQGDSEGRLPADLATSMAVRAMLSDHSFTSRLSGADSGGRPAAGDAEPADAEPVVRDRLLASLASYAAADADPRDSEKLLRALLAAEASVARAVDYDGRSALHAACAAGRVLAVELLLKLGFDASAADRWGHTPLWCAVMESRDTAAAQSVVSLLRAAGAQLGVDGSRLGAARCALAAARDWSRLRMLAEVAGDDAGDYLGRRGAVPASKAALSLSLPRSAVAL